MKKSDKNTIDELKRRLSAHETAHPSAGAPTASDVARTIRERNIFPAKKSVVPFVRRVAFAAAALVILAGSVSFLGVPGANWGLLNRGKNIVSDNFDAYTPSGNSELIAIFKQIEKNNRSGYFNFYGQKEAAMEDNALDGSGQDVSPTGGGGGSKYGETNVQVKGVDEPDIIKNDGSYLYTLAGNSVVIAKAGTGGSLEKTAVIKAAETESMQSLFIRGDRLVIFSTSYSYNRYGDDIMEYDVFNSATCHTAVYDISDRANPKLVKDIKQDGDFMSARLIDGELYILSSYSVYIYDGVKVEEACIPEVSVDDKTESIDYKDISVVSETEPNYLIVSGLNLDDLNADISKKAVLGGGGSAYCNAENLFVSRSVWDDAVFFDTGVRTDAEGTGDAAVSVDSQAGKTVIYKFSIGGGKVEFLRKGEISGQVLNQFSMDEHDGYFRIATTNGSWGSNTTSNVFVLDKDLNIVGKVENIAKGERIFAARFIGKTAYLVTFEQTDPLFVINLDDPKEPFIAGELKIPGFSNYLHPVSDTLLLGIGQNGNEDGTLPGVKLSLFDVSDPKNPKEADTYIIQGECYSEASNDHRAVMLYPEKGLFGIPVMRYITGENYYGAESSFLTIRVEGGKIVPERIYSKQYNDNAEVYYGASIVRGTYIDDTVYTMSPFELNAFSMTDGKLLDALEIADMDIYIKPVEPVDGSGSSEPGVTPEESPGSGETGGTSEGSTGQVDPGTAPEVKPAD